MTRRLARALAIALLLQGASALPLAAQGLGLGGTANNNKPINITADSGIEWDQNAQIYIARGHAVATRGTNEVDADVLIAHYRPVKGAAAAKSPGSPAGPTPTPTPTPTATAPAVPGAVPAKGQGAGPDAGGATEIYRIDAEGHVVLKSPSRTVVGDHAVYDVDQGVVVVTGKGLKMTTPSEIVTARDSLDWYDQKQIAVARGDAIATRNNGKQIRADILTAYMVKTPAPGAKPAAAAAPSRTAAKAAPGSRTRPGAAAPAADGETSKISRIDAQGHVVVVNGMDVGRGDYGVYNADTGIATLIDNVVLTRGQDIVKGHYAVMDLNRNISRIMPSPREAAGAHHPVEGLFVRDNAPAAAKTGRR